jgi:hypothetical protein
MTIKTTLTRAYLAALIVSAFLYSGGNDLDNNKYYQFQNCNVRPLGKWSYMVKANSKFPEVVWENPLHVRSITGGADFTVSWFNTNLQKVTRPSSPGRYMAFISGKTKKGTSFKRGFTVFCRPGKWQPWRHEFKAYPTLMPHAPVDELSWKSHNEKIAEIIGGQFISFLSTEESGAKVMSYLYEMPKIYDPKNFYDDHEQMNNEIWLKLKLSLADKSELKKLSAPGKTPKTKHVLQKGTLAEALNNPFFENVVANGTP